MLKVLDNLYIYLAMNEQDYIVTSLSKNAPARPFAPRRRP